MNHSLKHKKTSPFFTTGFTLFYAVLVSSLVLAIALSILGISVKEQELSIIGKQSQYAFFASDAGIECALEADSHPDTRFATSSSDENVDNDEIECGGNDIEITETALTASSASYEFMLPLQSGRCARVTVSKRDDGASPDLAANDGYSVITIESRGRNSCNASGNYVVERAIRVTCGGSACPF